jgi:hypothetical protein
MPFTRPDCISNGVSLSDKLTTLVGAFVSEDGAVNSNLTRVILELSPNKKGVSLPCSEDDLFTWATKEFWSASVFVVDLAVVSGE